MFFHSYVKYMDIFMSEKTTIKKTCYKMFQFKTQGLEIMNCDCKSRFVKSIKALWNIFVVM